MLRRKQQQQKQRQRRRQDLRMTNYDTEFHLLCTCLTLQWNTEMGEKKTEETHTQMTRAHDSLPSRVSSE